MERRSDNRREGEKERRREGDSTMAASTACGDRVIGHGIEREEAGECLEEKQMIEEKEGRCFNHGCVYRLW